MSRDGPHKVDVGRPSRRDISILVFVSAAILALPRLARAQDEPFKFGLTPVFLSNDLELLGHLRNYLAHRWGGRSNWSRGGPIRRLRRCSFPGKIHAAWICGYPYVQYQADLDLVATPVWHGNPLYQSYLIAARGSYRGRLDGASRRHPCVLRSEFQFRFLVTRALLAENRLRPDQFFSRTFFTYGHRNVIRAVASG